MRHAHIMEGVEGVLAHDEACRITHVSASVARLLGASGEDLLGRHLPSVLEPLGAGELVAACLRAREEGKTVSSRTRLDGHALLARVEAMAGGTWIHLRTVAEEDVAAHEPPLDRQLAQIWEHAPVCFAYLDRALRFRRVNRAYAQGAGVRAEDLFGRAHFDLYPDEDNEVIFRRVLETGEPYRAFAKPFQHPREDGGVTWWDWSIVPIRGETGEVEGLLLSLVEVTERLRSIDELRRSRELLAASENRFRTMYQEAPVGIELYDGRGGLVEANRACLEIFGLRDLESVRGFELLRDPSVPADMREAVEQGESARAVIHLDFDELDRRQPGQTSRRGTAWLDVHIIPAELCLDQVDGGFYVLVVDATAQKAAEDLLRASVREKDVLLQEIHHRVKNNLQVVSSLLQLQAHHATSDSDRELLRQSWDRIHAMAAVHEELYAAGDLSQIDLQRYVDHVVRGLAASHGSSGVRTTVDMGDFSVGIDEAIPLGLVVNELVTNALVHGFPDGGEGSVQVTLCPARPGWLVLTVRDDGVGLPGRFDPDQEGALGLFLVRSLCRQLHAEMEIEGKGGATFRILLPERHVRPQEVSR